MSDVEEKRIIPNGLDIKQYKGYKNWTKRRWAWEFLRRNKDFISRCKALAGLEELDREKSQKEIARDFGLKMFKHCDEHYGTVQDKSRPRFNAVAYWYNQDASHSKRLIVRFSEDQVLVRFDLKPASKDRKAIEAQLMQAEKALFKRIDQLDRKAPRRSRAPRKPAKDLEYLRMLDAKRDSNLSESEIYLMLNPPKTNTTKRIDKEELRQKFKNQYPAALQLTKHGYLTIALSAASKK